MSRALLYLEFVWHHNPLQISNYFSHRKIVFYIVYYSIFWYPWMIILNLNIRTKSCWWYLNISYNFRRIHKLFHCPVNGVINKLYTKKFVYFCNYYHHYHQVRKFFRSGRMIFVNKKKVFTLDYRKTFLKPLNV